jgi:xanthine dehydrogenase/oxidase
LAQRAASKVQIKYEDLPSIVTMDQAIQHDSFFSMGAENNITKGDPSKVINSKEVDDVTEGEVRIGGQEHFYLETNVVLVRKRVF